MSSNVEVALPEGYARPDFTSPLDVAAHLASVPAHAVVKGTVIDSILEPLKASGIVAPTTKKFMPFKDYPMSEFVQLVVDVAATKYPDAPLREGLRRIGADGMSFFMHTLVGKVMYGVFGRNVASIFKLANKSFELTQNTGKVATVILAKNAMRMSFTSTYSFVDSYHVGVVEGTLRASGREGLVGVKQTSPSDAEIYAVWAEVA